MPGFEQSEFLFSQDSPAREVSVPWRDEWARAAEELGRRLALPVGHPAEVRLVQGPVLRGVLQVVEETLRPDGDRERLRFRVGATTFCLAEIEAAVRWEA